MLSQTLSLKPLISFLWVLIMVSDHIDSKKQRWKQARNWYEGCDDLPSAFQYENEREELMHKTKNGSIKDIKFLREIRG